MEQSVVVEEDNDCLNYRSIASGVAISSPRNCTIKDKAGEVIVPSNDKEGIRMLNIDSYFAQIYKFYS